jgi:hypothetical protein
MISFELVRIKNHAVPVLIILGSYVLADNILSVIGLLVMVQCWAMCRVMFKEFNVYIGVQQRLHRSSSAMEDDLWDWVGVED